MKLKACFFLFVSISSSYAELSPASKEIFDIIYSSGRMETGLAVSVIEKINQTKFDRESQRVLAVIQAKSATENTEMLNEARTLAESYIGSDADEAEKDMVQIGLSAILNLSGERKAGCVLAEEILQEVDFENLAEKNKSYVDYFVKRYNIGSIGPKRFFQDELRRQIGGYYLNRKNDEGGPDLQKAFDVYSGITTQEVRDSCLADARFLKLKKSPHTETSVLPRSDDEKLKTQRDEPPLNDGLSHPKLAISKKSGDAIELEKSSPFSLWLVTSSAGLFLLAVMLWMKLRKRG